MSARPWTVEPHPNSDHCMVVDGTVVVAVFRLLEEHIARSVANAHNAALRLEVVQAVSAVNASLEKLLDPAQHYVVVTEHDGSRHQPPPCGWLAFHESLHGRTLHQANYWGYDVPPERQDGPLVGETYLGENSTLEAARATAKRQGDRYGKVRIARLEFLPGEA